MKIFLLTIFLTFFFAFFTTSVSAANTYYVSTTGNDNDNGLTLSTAWKSIQKGANSASPGNTIIVTSGNYSTQRVNITRSGSTDASITFQAQGTVVMKGFKIQANYITINGFEIANTDYVRWDTSTSSGVWIKGAFNDIENNYIHDSSLNGITLYGPIGDTLTTHDNIVRNNRVYHNEMVGIVVSGRNNLIEGNEV